MDNLIALYENNNLVIQTAGIISHGEIKIIDGKDAHNILYTHLVKNTDFINVKIELPPGKHQLQIITTETKLVKEIHT